MNGLCCYIFIYHICYWIFITNACKQHFDVVASWAGAHFTLTITFITQQYNKYNIFLKMEYSVEWSTWKNSCKVQIPQKHTMLQNFPPLVHVAKEHIYILSIYRWVWMLSVHRRASLGKIRTSCWALTEMVRAGQHCRNFGDDMAYLSWAAAAPVR